MKWRWRSSRSWGGSSAVTNPSPRGSTTRQTARRVGGVVASAGAFFALWRLRTEGPDFPQYLAWARVAVSGDIFDLPTRVVSPSGVPFFQWAFGPGFLFALGRPSGVSPEGAAMAVGFASGVAVWLGLYRLLRVATNGDLGWTLLGLLVAFLGTHVGFYSHVHATESLSLGAMVGLALVLFDGPGVGALTALGVGSLSALLILQGRPQFGVYVLIGLAVVAWRLPGEATPLVRLRTGVLVLAPLLGAGLATGVVNRWMTGSFWRTPYDFGDADFRSLDVLRPHVGAVLVHPWHGLLLYHPLYALGFAALVYGAVSRALPTGERLLWGALTIAFAVHLYVQASWYAWWLGTDTFGMRGMAIAGIYLVPVLMRAICFWWPPRQRNLAIVGMGLACLVSTVFLWQGTSNYQTATQLWEGFRSQASSPKLLWPLGASVASAAVTGVWARRRRQPETVRVALLAALGGLVTAYLVRGGLPLAYTALAAVVGAALVVWLGTGKPRPSDMTASVGRLAPLASGMAIVMVLVTGALLARVVTGTERFRASNARPPRAFEWVATVQVDEIEGSYHELLLVDGFNQEKTRLHAFLDRIEAVARVSRAGRAHGPSGVSPTSSVFPP
jgi:hypothetical protein